MLLSDEELEARSVDNLRAVYRQLRVRFLEVEAARDAAQRLLSAKDRGAILRMAGNIASGMYANPSVAWGSDGNQIPRAAAEAAREILAEVNSGE